MKKIEKEVKPYFRYISFTSAYLLFASLEEHRRGEGVWLVIL
jgi:hypothetical protein